MFIQFKEGVLPFEYRSGMESSDKYDYDSTLLPLISEDKIDKMSSGDESDAKPMLMDM